MSSSDDSREWYAITVRELVGRQVMVRASSRSEAKRLAVAGEGGPDTVARPPIVLGSWPARMPALVMSEPATGPGAPCWRCDRPIPAEKRIDARYCGRVCRRGLETL